MRGWWALWVGGDSSAPTGDVITSSRVYCCSLVSLVSFSSPTWSLHHSHLIHSTRQPAARSLWFRHRLFSGPGSRTRFEASKVRGNQWNQLELKLTVKLDEIFMERESEVGLDLLLKIWTQTYTTRASHATNCRVGSCCHLHLHHKHATLPFLQGLLSVNYITIRRCLRDYFLNKFSS